MAEDELYAMNFMECSRCSAVRNMHETLAYYRRHAWFPR